MPLLNVFRLRDTDNSIPKTFDKYVDSDDFTGWQRLDYSDSLLTARLYIPPVSVHDPGWRNFIVTGFPQARVGTVQTAKALVLCSVLRYKKPRCFAITFGHARHMLRPDYIEPGFGLRAALNILYEGVAPGTTEEQSSRIRQIDARTIESNIRRQRVQRSKEAVFEAYGIAPERDLLDRIVGTPPDQTTFGSRVTGANALALHKDLEFSELGPLLRALLTAHARTTYRAHFEWLDKVVPVTDAQLLERLQDRTVALLQAEGTPLDITPPALLDWAAVGHFTFNFGKPIEYQEVDLRTYLEAVNNSRVHEIDIGHLKRHRLVAKDGDGSKIAQWSILKCLFGTFELAGQTFVLDEGQYYQVDPAYLNDLDAFVANLPSPQVSLPPTTAATWERDYNEEVANASDSILLLDRKTVRPPSATTGIEICDLLTVDGEFVHVKRELASSSLSHMFAQGYVSAETLHADSDYRAAVRERIKQEADQQGKDAEAFRSLVSDPLVSSNLTVVYAVVANWDGKKPGDRLPFFSKVNMRHSVRQLQRMGFRTAFATVDAP